MARVFSWSWVFGFWPLFLDYRPKTKDRKPKPQDQFEIRNILCYYCEFKLMSTETPLDLKKTVNLPKTAFSQKANLAQNEPARLEKWGKLDLYRLIRRSSEGRPKFILHDGPPYANADIHLGTAMN